MKIALKNLGCAKNQVDAEYLLGDLKSVGHEIINNYSQANCIIVNTCGFIESAKQESIEEIFSLLKYKTNGNCAFFIVTGCLAQRYVDELAEEIPEIDAILGVGSLKEIRDLLATKENSNSAIKFKGEGYFLNNSEMQRHLLSPEYSVYLKIADGCDNRCTYCAIPFIRGNYRSRTINDILEEARHNIKNGVKEINIIAQDTTSYGIDIYGSRKLTDLLSAIVEIEGDFWVRVLYCYPEFIDDNLLKFIASSPKMCKYIDMPIQHVHPEIIRLMNRKLSGDELLILIDRIRSLIPDVMIRSTFMVGFPGERKIHFDYLSDFLLKAQLDWAGIFAYSREENTPADKLPNHVLNKTKLHRQHLLNAQQSKISTARLHKYLTKSIKVLVEGKSELNETAYIGRSMFHAPDVDGIVFFTSEQEIPDGTLVDVTVTHIDGFDLIGEKRHELSQQANS